MEGGVRGEPQGLFIPLTLALALAGCDGPKPRSTPSTTDTPPPMVPITTAAPPAVAGPPKAPRRVLDGRDFPDKVLALTWDDGPDQGTLDLAKALHDARVSGTFFVVAAWKKGLSSDPGEGLHVFETGHDAIPVLADLVRLGHRVANHTRNHVLLSDVDAATVTAQLADNQAKLDPFQRGALPLFRAPGGAWSERASAAVDADPRTRDLVGPIRWDVDGKDWEKSLYCRSDAPARECEPKAPGGASRVKASVVAKRYLDAIEAAGRGIVLFHDRVGHVGSRYAVEIAKQVIPALVAKGYVFAAPVLRFSELAPRPSVDIDDIKAHRAALSGDLNGDGRLDTCARTPAGIECSLHAPGGPTRSSLWLDARALDEAGLGADAGLSLVDVNGDGRADLCGRGARGAMCALAP